MSQKINDLGGSAPAANPSLGPARPAAPAGSGTPSSSAETGAVPADVHITDTASFLASLEPALRGAPAVDAARVAAIRTAIEQGQYVVHPGHVAAQLTHIERALGQLRGGSPPPAAPADGKADES
ncbi:MAG: flagellar biosynthesis anti-sigma factor FlgM [Proteobacteria bacterium]|nr:flagellar biosynthesis anti-sigma factor FlgM [Pseudomonadota bacterium]